ncbi:phosphonate ABC transporter substrate-binding protein [Kaistia sp. 32K]|uniref:phosphate/phosphite/phosphonate ABC transporter substrate-binding protein n=1 Tax=Kaistia sp. 32K TaxID=2795690 RepID=UPI0019155C85|nr:phosphate/phosphite/phosphonate ABC transporter substrate-binding protein [Kaistia sp. 32K]BCP56141.1 phosphonate ABC transporter substrate-binding protein [Kaistia sp. 32K]
MSMRRRIALFLAALALATWPAAGPAAASWRDDLGTLKVGFVAGDNPTYETARLEKFRWHLQYSLAVPVELFPARNYEALIEAQSTGRIQYGVLSSLAYLALNQRCDCAEPLAQPTTVDHARGFRALLVTKSDGPIATLADARNTRLAVGAADSLSGRRAPLAGLAAEGIDPESYFVRILETDDSEAALTALAKDEADIATAWSSATDPLSAAIGSGPFARLASNGTLSPSTLRVVWQSELIPFGPHAVRKDIPDEAKVALLRALTEMQTAAPEAYDAIERGYPGGFVAADPALYEKLAALLNVAPAKR